MAKRSFIGTRDRTKTKGVRQTPDVQQPVEDGLTLQQALTRFIRSKEAEGVRTRTIREYVNHIGYLSDYMTEVRGHREAILSDLTSEVIHEYVTYLLTEKRRYADARGRRDKTVGLSENTVNIRLRTLKTMCRFWHAERLIADNPMGNIRPVKADEAKEVEGLTEAEVELLLNSYDETQFAEWRDKTLCLLLLDTGLRIQEATGLTVERIDFRTLTLLVPSSVAKNRRNREVPVSKEIARILHDLHDETCQYFGETEHIFNTAYGEPFTADSFRKRLNRRKIKLGIPRLSPHQFRHTFARDYLLNGGDLFTLQKILDHADIKTTRKYIQMNADHIRQQHTKHSPVRKYVRARR